MRWSADRQLKFYLVERTLKSHLKRPPSDQVGFDWFLQNDRGGYT